MTAVSLLSGPDVRAVRDQDGGGVQVMGGSEVPGVETLTPGLICFPPMNVAPMMTCSGPTFGGMKVKTGDAVDEDAEAGGVVAALAPATGAARTSGARAAAIAASFRVRITSLRGRDPLRRADDVAAADRGIVGHHD
jgi:hypothetical protein